MQDWIVSIMNDFGYIGVALLIAIENIFPPIPSEVILTFAGFMTTYTSMNIWLTVLFATIGSVTGAMVLYGIGRLLPTQKLERIIDKWGRILGLKKEDVGRAEGWFIRHGAPAIFFCRFVPIVRSLISIPAGMARIRKRTFLIYTAIGTAIWNTVLIFLGAFARAGWERVNDYIDIYSHIAYVALAIVTIAFAIWFISKVRKRR